MRTALFIALSGVVITINAYENGHGTVKISGEARDEEIDGNVEGSGDKETGDEGGGNEGNGNEGSGNEGSGDDGPSASPSTTEASSITTASQTPIETTLAPVTTQSKPESTEPETTTPQKDTRCDSCVPDHMDLYKACLASENLVGSTGTIYYGTQMFECPCVVEYKLENGQGEPTYTVDGTLESCLVAKYYVPNIGYAQTWAVAVFFVCLVIAAIYALLFAHNVKPTTIPPYNKGVMALFVLLLVLCIITFCGMSVNINKNGQFSTAFAACSFTMFTLAVSGFLVYGLVTESANSAYVS